MVGSLDTLKFSTCLRVTAEHRLYIWGHPSNRKLGHVGFNHDGTEAGEDPGIGAKQKSKAKKTNVQLQKQKIEDLKHDKTA